MTQEPRRGFGRLTGAVTDKVIDSIDPDQVVQQIDVNALLDRIDVNAVLDRVDIDRLLDRVDLDRLLARADVADLVQRSEVPDLVAASTGRFAGSALDIGRRQLVVLDVVFGQVVDRIFRRPDLAWSHTPVAFRTEAPRLAKDGRLDVTGRYAGPFTRLAAAVADLWLMLTVGTLLLAGIDYLDRSVLDRGPIDTSGPAVIAVLVVLAFGFAFFCLEIAGRTPGKALVGLRVVAWDGQPLGPGAAFRRTVAFPISLGLAGLGCLGVALQKDRRALHDKVAGSAVVHDWSPRKVELPPGLSRTLAGGSIT